MNSFQQGSTGRCFGRALEAFGIEASVDLGVMTPGQSLSELTSKILLGLENHFKNSMRNPDLVLAHGDTTTCFATAVSSFYHRIPFFHVEAGLRTHRLNSPFPEEFNRQTIAPIAKHHFAPTQLEKTNLLQDGVSPQAITVTGSTVHEAVRVMQSREAEKIPLLSGFRSLVVVTLHRREASESLERILSGIRSAALSRPDADFVCPVHPSPLVKQSFQRVMQGLPNVTLIEPLAYPRFISLLTRANLVVTDSGGVQEEAAFLGKRVLIARQETERADGIQAGLVKLMGMNPEKVRRLILEGLEDLTSLGSQEAQNGPRYRPGLVSLSASQMITQKVLGALA